MAVRMRYGTNTLTGQETESGGGGSTETKTLLWTNASPGTVGTLTANLSESMDNYDSLEIEVGYNASATERTLMRFPVFKSNGTEYTYTPLSTAYRSQLKGGIVIYDGSSVTYVRRFTQTSSTTIEFTACTRVGASGTSNAGAIPFNIYGIKINS